MAEEEYDVVIIGAGPGGYVAAIRAAQLGMRVGIVEREEVGGLCLNWGCIPTKALLRNAEVLSLFHRAAEFGVSFDNLRYDFAHAIDRSRKVVARLVRGVSYLLRKNKVTVIKGEAYLSGMNRVEVKETGQVLHARNILVATGARPKTLPFLPVDGKQVLTSREALELKEVPSPVLIIGGGATGVEFAYLYNAYGAMVTLVEMMPTLLPQEDEEIARHLERSLSKQGIQVWTNSRVTGVTREQGRLEVKVLTPQGEKEVFPQRILVAVGVQGNSDNLGLEELGVEVEDSFVKVDRRMATNVPGVYAIGDVTGKMPLAHVASAQGVLAVEAMAEKDPQPMDYDLMPRAVYCRPQVASFGLTEREARERGLKVKIGRFPFLASGKALAMGEEEGLVKLVVREDSQEVVGAHMMGAEVTELVSELSLSRLLEGTAYEVGWLVHPHPTLSEALKEAALDAQGRAVHQA